MTTRQPSSYTLIQNSLLWLLRWGIKLLLRLEVTGIEHIPATGPAVIIINHIAFLDPLMVCGVSPGVIIPLAKKEAFDSFLWRPFLKLYGAIPVLRGEADIRAIKLALQVLKQNGIILMAPEGTRSPTYQLQPAKEGATMVALRSEAAIVPIGITGTHQIKAHWLKLKRAPVQLAVGQPFRLRSNPLNSRAHRAEMAVMTQELMYRLAQQLPPEFRGVYNHPEEATEIYLVPAKD